jgi:hypothetical protein
VSHQDRDLALVPDCATSNTQAAYIPAFHDLEGLLVAWTPLNMTRLADTLLEDP